MSIAESTQQEILQIDKEVRSRLQKYQTSLFVLLSMFWIVLILEAINNADAAFSIVLLVLISLALGAMLESFAQLKKIHEVRYRQLLSWIDSF